MPEVNPAIAILSEHVSDLSRVVREHAVKDAEFQVEMRDCCCDARLTYKKVFIEGEDSILGQLRVLNEKVEKLEEKQTGWDTANKDIRIANINNKAKLKIAVLTLIGGSLLAYVKLFTTVLG